MLTSCAWFCFFSHSLAGLTDKAENEPSKIWQHLAGCCTQPVQRSREVAYYGVPPNSDLPDSVEVRAGRAVQLPPLGSPVASMANLLLI